MDNAKPIGELIAKILIRTEYLMGIQVLLRGCATATDRKQLILTGYENGHLVADEVRLLIEAWGLETA